ncbi:MAG: UDP-3-O-acyl-N-acetylglucosamine deacetylase [Alistipes indistinctus]
MDGSAREYAQAIACVGLQEQDVPTGCTTTSTKKTVFFDRGCKGVEIAAYPDDKFTVNVNIDFDPKILGNQYASARQHREFFLGNRPVPDASFSCTRSSSCCSTT